MTLFSEKTSPLEEAWVALDLETTGLDPNGDEIIEVGAVKFEGDRVLDTYHTFVNPFRTLSGFITRYTGIAQADVDVAPPFSSVVADLASFIGMTPIVGHNLRFDLGFLDRNGLRLGNPRCDTWELAYVLLPGLPDYSLTGLAGSMGVDLRQPHRAVEDALATRGVFLMLGEELASLDIYTLATMQRLAARSQWMLSHVLTKMEAWKLSNGSSRTGEPGRLEDGRVGVTGLDVDSLKSRLQWGKALRSNQVTRDLDPEYVASLFAEGSPLARALPGFEERPEQAAMARAVAEAINGKGRLIVEAGTGVGKSLAYLLPAVLHALMNNSRVVVSTNTINLQEQLLTKDIPALASGLSEVEGVSADDFKYSQLKGRANYLCLRRWSHLRSSESLSESEARLLAKTLMWLQTTSSGDRSELNLGHPSAAGPWERLSAQGAQQCLGLGGPCFLRAARDRAAASHLVIVNHALLMSNLTTGGALIPDHDILIVDEAHHLEEEATRHLGFEVSQPRIDEQLRSLVADRSLLSEAVAAFRGSKAAETRRESVEKAAVETASRIPSIRDHAGRLFALLAGLLADQSREGREPDREMRITSATRAQPAWSQLEIQWENVDVSLGELAATLARLRVSLEGLDEAGLINYEDLMIELANAEQWGAELRERLREFVAHPKADGIYWVSLSGPGGDMTLRAAPLQVGEALNSLLYSQKECVVMTSATLSANRSFDYIRERTGFCDSQELLLGSPFDYPNAAMLCVPDDMPEPSTGGYPAAAARAIIEGALAAEGRAMALFTSHASLRTAAGAIREDLESNGVRVLAQGIDGTPSQLMRRFLEDPSAVLLGTASFWEGVDLAGESLKVLMVMRLPFNVPSEPVFSARSDLYEDSFYEYAVPQAVLRLRQGFGRLIRSKTDRGVVVVLDRRILARRYGKLFVEALPDVAVKTCPLADMRNEIADWIGR